MNKKHLALYALKYNPFLPDVPIESLHRTPQMQSFCWRVEQLVGDGGFAVISGPPGTGKSAGLRILAERLSEMRDVKVGYCVGRRPASGTSIARWAICLACS